MRDIETRDDCEALVRAFYLRAFEDPLIGWLFTDVARLDREAHVPRITSVWETALRAARACGGGAFRAHAELCMWAERRGPRFARWLVWCGPRVAELCAGERAELAKSHAQRVAHAFHGRLATLPAPASAEQ